MNILHGDSAGGSFKQAFKLRQEEMLVFHDVLSCGPLAKYISIEAWRKFRERYWNNLDKESSIENSSYSPGSGFKLKKCVMSNGYRY